MLLSRAQRPLATTPRVVRDEEAAGSNPVTPTSVSAGERPCPIRGGVFALPRTATKYRNSAHRRASPSLRSASLVAVELALA
jgi:predicted RecA/RadA family phage recombinase